MHSHECAFISNLHCGSQVHDNAPGKYTVGLQQNRIAFCGDNEDATSMALTALTRLLQRTGVSYQAIGRLEVFFFFFFCCCCCCCAADK